RISFQHQASRLRGPRQELRRTRAWAAWALVRQARPSLPGDLADPVDEPSWGKIEALLQEHGHQNEAKLWRAVIVLNDSP
ncbi:MAG TPA: hypothetical protein VJ952_12775, partial [Opitutales bacterium]|nr:hypothetical protein [Opitutales bacterium]